MSEAKMSYLRGFRSGNDYRANGLFPGNAGNPGFAVSAMWRDRYPDFTEAFASQERFVCGNLKQTAPNVYAGWAITLVPATLGQVDEIRFNFADSSGVLTWFQIDLTENIEAQRTILLQVFFGLSLSIKTPNDTAMVFLNGTLVALFAGLPGYTPASQDAPFVIGGVPPTVTADPAATVGFAGMSYSSQVCEAPQSADSIPQVQRIASNQWEDVNATEDIRDGQEATITDMFSVRRGLPDVQDDENLTWEATKGSAVLTRNGTTGLAVEACKPRYLCGNVTTSLQPQPN